MCDDAIEKRKDWRHECLVAVTRQHVADTRNDDDLQTGRQLLEMPDILVADQLTFPGTYKHHRHARARGRVVDGGLGVVGEWSREEELDVIRMQFASRLPAQVRHVLIGFPRRNV